MSLLSTPFELISRGGSSAISGVMFLVLEFVVLLLAASAARRLAAFSGTKKFRIKGRVRRKYVIPEHREWQGKAYVTEPAKNALEIDVETRTLQFSPAPWKYDRVSEGDEVDVAIQKGRFGGEMRVLDIGPF